MNKKAFEEMELLELRCGVENKKNGMQFKPVLELQGGNEVYSVYVYKQEMDYQAVETVLSAKNYTEIEKKFTRFVNGK